MCGQVSTLAVDGLVPLGGGDSEEQIPSHMCKGVYTETYCSIYLRTQTGFTLIYFQIYAIFV